MKDINRGFLIGGCLGLIGTVAGAYGAHGLRPYLTPAQQNAWETATRFNLIHAGVQIALVAAMKSMSTNGSSFNHLKRAFYLMTGGTVLFSGSIYALCLGAPKLLGPVTPLGGLLLIAGWFFVALAGL